ncbi:alpha/beta hydrolase [Marinomonas algarum]|uniref:Alpha/beta hydrolase n=1 Tax=Marinomonas algarum TaxID=2883105 RepID=A0A9X1INA4_9GAMM|nr:alpha/beta hydrolase [Marinomonas algarum]MCB5161451.1 alpha/beta hydrolase [Marinomonas algarum]
MTSPKNIVRTMPWLGFLAILFLSGCSSFFDSPESTAYQKAKYSPQSLQIEVEGNTAYVFGVLGSDLVDSLKDMVEAHPNVTDVMLVDVPGSLDQQATMEGARLIRRLGLNTHIAPTGYVLSGGVDLFLGGVNRTIGSGAGVGVHAWSDGTTTTAEELNMADPVHAVYVNFYLEMGVPERFYWFSLDAAPAERVYFLSPEEVYDFQLVTQ